MHYRRLFIPGASYFFTVVTARRRNIFHDDRAVRVLRQAFRNVKRERPFDVDAVVVLPDHLHTIWRLPEGDSDFPTRWRLIKTWFTKHCDPALRCGSQAVWQNRFWEHVIRDQADFNRHVDYIHHNPVKHGFVEQPSDWRSSSFHGFVQRGLLPPDWGADGVDLPDNIGGE